MALPLAIAGAAALFSVGKGIYDSIKQGEHNSKMQKILAAKKAPTAAPAPPPQSAPAAAPSAPIGAPAGAPGAAMAPMPNQAPPTQLNMPSAPPPVAPPPMVGGMGAPNPMMGMAGATPGALGMGPPPNPLEQDPMKPKNPWELYSPSVPT